MKPKPKEKNKGATNHPTQHHWHEMNRKQRREMMRKMQSEDLSLEVDQGAAFYELQHRELQIKRLKAKAEKLGYRITPIPAAA